MSKTNAIPRFYLLGEPPKDVDHDFLHLEEIKDRTAPLHGQIRPHMHTDLNHFFLITHGSGRVIGDTDALEFDGAHVLFIPAGFVHGFDFSPDISGFVLTVASAHLNDLFRTRTDLSAPKTLQALAIHERATLNCLRLWILRLRRELLWEAPAQLAAVEANLLGLMTEFHRLACRQIRRQEAPLAPHQRLLARFREQVENHYTEPLELSSYLRTLRISEAQLRYACQKGGEKSPMQILLDRRLIEAKRLLLYSDLSISDCSLQVGFEDPAYFSRLFRRQTGQSPRSFRAGRR